MESSNPRAGRKSRKLGSRRRHQMKEVADEDGPPALDSEWPSQATEELQDFFRECGAEQKGFITREDLRKAKFSFLGNPEELELIFEWLDPERKGSLTIKEFTSGLKNVFSSQTRIPGSRKKKPRTWVFSKEEPTSFQRLEEVDPEERRWFLSFMEQLGTDHLSLDQAEIWQLWKKLRQEEPHLVGNLEGFLAKVTSRLRETQAEKETLQMTLKKYDDDHHREVQQLYEEMEHQIHSEKQRLQAASDTQGLAYSSMMHQALEAKEQEMQYLAEGQRELEAQIDLLKSKRHEVSLENQRLQETQRDLTGQLEQVQGQLQVTRGHLNLARGQVAWQVEEETSLSSDPPVDPKNTSDSQHFTSFPEEDPLPSLFEEGDWSQLLSNFTSPLSGNTTQISWSPPPTPTSLKGYHTPRIVRQISITKRNSWQFNQESPSDPEVLPRSPLGSSEAPAVVLELKVAGEPKPGKTFQLDFQRVSSGEPAITTWGQAAPELGDSLASSDSLPSQELAGPGKGFGETDGDEVGQGDGPISDILSKGPSSEESLQTLGPSADMQADTWKVSAKEIPHPGLPPAGSEQEVGSWGKEVFTLGSDVPVESPEHLVLIEEGIPMMEKEREKMNTEGWEMETNQQNNVRGLETELRESAGSVVSEVPGEESKSTESPGPDAGEILGEGYRSTESPGPDADEILGEGSQSTELPGPDVGEVPREESRNVELPGPDVGEVPREESRNVELPGPDAGEILGEGYRSTESPGPDDGEVLVEDSRFTKSPGPDVENALSQKAELTDSPGPDIGNPDAQETSHVVSSRTVVDSVLSQEEQILRSLESDVEKVPGQKSQLIHLVRVIELPGTVIGNATEKKSELMMSPRQDTDNAFGQKEGMDVGNVLCEEAGILESAELERDNHPGPEIGLLSSSSPDVDVYPSYEVTLLKSYQPGVGDTTELHRLTVRNASDHEARIRISPEIDTSSQEAGLTGSPGPDEDDISGHRTRFMESWKTDIKDASGKEAQVLYSPEPEVGETFRQENVFMSSLGPDRADVTGQKAGTGIGDAAIQEARTTELCKDDVRNASDQGSELMESPELHVDDTVSQENGFIQSDKTDTEKISEQEVEILYSSGLDSSNAPGQGAGYIESPGSDVSDVAVQKAGLMNSSVIDSADSPSQEDKLMLPEKEVSLSAIQKSDVESGLDVGNSPSQETRHDIGGTFLYSPGPDTGDTLSQETRHTEPTMMDVDDATVQRPGVIELSKVDVGNVSDQENRLIKSSGIDAPIGKIELVEFSGPEMGDALSREVKFEGLCEMDVGDVEMAEIMYSPVPDIRDSLGQKSGVVELHGLCVSEISIQQARVLESDVRDGPGQGIMPKEFHEADVGNASAQDTEIMHSPRPGVRDSAGLEAETVHSPGPYVGDSIGQEAGVPELDVGNAPDQETRFMPSCETHVSGACEEEAEILHSPGPDEEDSPGQEGEPKESSMLDLGEAPGQEGSILKISETDVDIGSSQQTRETESPGPSGNEAPGQEAGIGEIYEIDMRDALGNEIEFGPDGGDAASNEGILILETQQSDVSDASNSDQVVEFIESCGPEVGDISHQEAEIMNSPGSDRCDAFRQETMFMELGETHVGNAEITYSPVPDMSESLGQEVKVLESPETDVRDGLSQEVMTRESYEADVGNVPDQDTETMHSPRPGVRDSAGPEAETVHSPGPYGGDSIGQEAGVPEVHRDVGNASDLENRFMPSSETHVSGACEEAAEVLHSPGPNEEDSLGQETELKESSMLNLGEGPGQEGSFLELSEAGVDTGSSQQTRETGSPGPNGNEASGQEAGIGETYETDMRDALDNEVEFGPDAGDAARNEGILMLETQQSDVSDASNSGQVVEFIESCGPEVGDVSHQEAEIMNSLGSDRCDAFHQEIMFMEQRETDVGNAEITYSPFPDMSESLGQEVRVLESPETDVRDGLGQEVITRESYEADVGNAPDQDTEIMPSPKPGVRDSAGPEAETVHSPGPYVGDPIGQEAGVPELDVGNAPDQEARFMPSSETHVSDVCEEEAEILHSPGPDGEDSLVQETEPKESSMLDLGGAPGQEGSFLELSEAGAEDVFSHQVEQTGSLGSGVRDILGQEAEFKKSYEIKEEDTLGLEQPTVLEETASQEGSFLESPEEGVENGSRQQTGQIRSPGPDVEDTPGQKAEIRESYETDVRDALDEEGEFDPNVGHVAAGQGSLMLGTQEPDVGDASRIDQITGLIESCGPEVGDISHQEAEIMNSSGSDRYDAFCQEDKFGGLCETVVGDAEMAEILYSAVPDVNDSPGQEAGVVELRGLHVSELSIQQARVLESDVRDYAGQGIMTKESDEADVGNASAQAPEITPSPRPGVRDSASPEAETVHSPGPYGGDSISQETGVLELDVGNAPDQEARFMSSSETHVSGACEEDAEILHSPGPDVGDAASNEGILMLKTQQSNVSEAFNSGQVVEFIESCGPEVGDVSHQEAEIMNSPGSDRCDAFRQETMFMEQGETDVGNAEITYSPFPDMSESLGQEVRVLESPETDVRDGPGQQVMTRESYEVDVGNAPDQDTEIMPSPRAGVRDSAGPEAETVHSPGPCGGDFIGQKAGVPELDVGNAPDQEARFMPLSETHVSDVCEEEAEILHSPGPDGEDSLVQETEPKESSMLDLGGAPGQEGSFLELSETGVDIGASQQTRETESSGSGVRDILGQEAEFKKSCEIYEEDTLGLVQPTVLEEIASQEGSFLESSEEGVDTGSSRQTREKESPGPNVNEAPSQEAGIGEPYETDMRDALDNEIDFGPDGGDAARNEGILMLETQQSDVSDASNSGQVVEFIESCGPEVGDISHQEAEIMNSPGSDRCDAFCQETMFMERGETDVGNAETIYSLVPDMSESLGQEVRVLESPETDVRDGLGQGIMTKESHEADMENASAQDTEIMPSPRPGVRDSAGPEAETVHSPGLYVGDSIGQEAGVPELDVGNASDQEARFMLSSETHVSDVASKGAGNRELRMVLGEDIPDQEAEILHLPGPDGEDSPGQEAALGASPVQVLEGVPIQESRFLELAEAGVQDWSCKQAGLPGSPAPDVRDTPVKETEILHSPNRVVSDYPHQGTDRLIDSFRPIIDILSDEEVQLPKSSGPRVGDAPEKEPGNVESPRPDVLPVVPERGGLQDQNSEAVWRAEDGVLQRQAREGFWLPKDSPGDTLGTQDAGQALSVPLEAEAQPECKVLGGQIIPLSEPREENSLEVMKKANLKSQVQATRVSPGGEAPEPDYLFHVLFLGDSNVGKTSFLHLLHHDSFATGLTATVGMDYRIKNLMVDNRWFALQLWDTAGQERYHSITKQFLRKADGIVLMYDVTCPGSFTHVRYWLDCIQERGPDDVVILLLGNKIDCVKERLVSTEAGQLLAKEIGVIFGECSAVLGHNILEPIMSLARAMQEQDTKMKHSVVKLEKKEVKKAGCCS
uniref:RAB44, member RAS onco family n=1 Tax=Sarcophilus harrisii TaxID=9305 RepID=A0A7N4NSH9_SARHA